MATSTKTTYIASQFEQSVPEDCYRPIKPGACFYFKLLLSHNEQTAATWKKLTIQADQKSDKQKSDKIVDELLSRRR